MKITAVEISNFKAIESTRIALHPTFNVIVGANGSGKSSVLQALHWMAQTARNLSVEPKRAGTSTLSEKNAIYMPSPDYRNAGHGSEYGNKQGMPQFGLTLEAEIDGEPSASAAMWIKAARNEGISVHVPTGNSIVATIRDRTREISAYIPGVAGIPLVEEKRSLLLVRRSAAAGDSNTVLRNILDLLRGTVVEGENGLKVVCDLVSEVMGPFELHVEFDESKHTRIIANFRTGEMRDVDDRAFKPLELAGIGYLQVLQIFSYLVYFRPHILLVDEPDAHLYPIAQERLVRVLGVAAQRFDSQILLTTHSPSVVRALPSESKVIWMDGGRVQPAGDSGGRNLMGWGLLDRRIVLMTEDSQTGLLRSLISQWPNLERATAIWPYHGTGKLPKAETVKGLVDLFGGEMKVAIHRDRDFLMPPEVEAFVQDYERFDQSVWVTAHSDIEAYWTNPDVVAAHFNIDRFEAKELLDAALNALSNGGQLERRRRQKRLEALNKLNNNGCLPHYGDSEVEREFTRDSPYYGAVGKDLLRRIRDEAQNRHLPMASSFGARLPTQVAGTVARDLHDFLTRLLDP